MRSMALILCFGLVLVAAGCKTSAPPLPGATHKSNLTPGLVKANVVSGKTTQTDVLVAFGAPNIITRDQSGKEVWTYDVQSVSHTSAQTSKGGGMGAGAAAVAGSVPIAGGAGAGGSKSTSVGQVSSTTSTLMITFDENEVVDTYRFLSTAF